MIFFLSFCPSLVILYCHSSGGVFFFFLFVINHFYSLTNNLLFYSVSTLKIVEGPEKYKKKKKMKKLQK